jgi:hypothetical protein
VDGGVACVRRRAAQSLLLRPSWQTATAALEVFRSDARVAMTAQELCVAAFAMLDSVELNIHRSGTPYLGACWCGGDTKALVGPLTSGTEVGSITRATWPEPKSVPVVTGITGVSDATLAPCGTGCAPRCALRYECCRRAARSSGGNLTRCSLPKSSLIRPLPFCRTGSPTPQGINSCASQI